MIMTNIRETKFLIQFHPRGLDKGAAVNRRRLIHVGSNKSDYINDCYIIQASEF